MASCCQRSQLTGQLLLCCYWTRTSCISWSTEVEHNRKKHTVCEALEWFSQRISEERALPSIQHPLYLRKDILLLLPKVLRLHQRLVDPILPARQLWSPCQIDPAARMCAPCRGCKEDVEQMEAHGWSHEHRGLGIISSFRVSWWAIFSPSC